MIRTKREDGEKREEHTTWFGRNRNEGDEGDDDISPTYPTWHPTWLKLTLLM